MNETKTQESQVESQENKELTAEEVKAKRVAAQIEEILTKENMALEPYIAYGQHSIRPLVRLAFIPNNDNTTPDSGDGEQGEGESEGVSEPSES